jgi:hypothetical protein
MINNIKRLSARLINQLSIWSDAALSGSVIRQFLLLFGFFIFLYLFWLSMAYIIIHGKTEQINKDIPNPGWSIIAQMIDPGNQHQVGSPNGNVAQNEVHWKVRLFVLLLSLSGTFAFGGLLISTLTNVFEQRVAMVRDGMMNYRFSGHTVILGYHDISKGLVIQLLPEGKSRSGKVVVLTEGNIPEIRKVLKSEIAKKQYKRLYLLAGTRTSTSDLIRCGVDQAMEIYVLGEQHEPDHDPKSNKCLQEINTIALRSSQKRKERIPCHVLFNSQTTHLLYQYGNIKLTNESEAATAINIQSFSFEESWAKKVFLDDAGCTEAFPPLDFEAISSDSEKYVHLIIAGMTRMGFALAVQAARVAHFANHHRQKTQITFIDAEAERERNYFASRYQSFYASVDKEIINLFTGETTRESGNLPFINIELRFVTGHFESPAVRQNLQLWASDPNALTTLAIAFNNPATNMAAALYLPDELYSRNIRILVKQDYQHSVVSLLSPEAGADKYKFRHVKAFGMCDNCPGLLSPDDFRAKLVNHFYCSGNQLPVQFTPGTFAKMQEKWNCLPERHKWSSRNNAESIPVKLRAIGLHPIPEDHLQVQFSPAVIEFLAQIEKSRWNADALLSGYEPPSPEVLKNSMDTADAITKAITEGADDEQVNKIEEAHKIYVKVHKINMVHPCLVPYDQLSEYYKDIDRRLVKSIPIIEKFHAQHTEIS